MKIPIFVPLFSDCAITNYGLYSDSETVSEPFDQVYDDLTESEQMVEFKIKEEYRNNKEEYPYVVRATTDSDVVLLTASNSFETVCGPRTFTAPVIDPVVEYVLDGNRPTLSLPIWASFTP